MRIGIVLLVIVIGLTAGLGVGLTIGWLFPINAPQTTPAELGALWKSDYVLMVAQAYGLDGNLDAAQQRLSELGYADLGEAVIQRGKKAIAENSPPEDIGRLARLAAALGARAPELAPYLAK
jgi:hypothetical protein